MQLRENIEEWIVENNVPFTSVDDILRLVSRLKDYIVNFTYRKKDGTEREAIGTLNIEILQRMGMQPAGKKMYSDTFDGYINYFDLRSDADKRPGWKKFRIDQILHWHDPEEDE